MTKREEMTKREKRLLKMLRLAEDTAIQATDGHLTIMRFTTGWKIMLATPVMTIDGHDEVKKLPIFKSLEAALEDFWHPLEIPLEDKCCDELEHY